MKARLVQNGAFILLLVGAVAVAVAMGGLGSHTSTSMTTPPVRSDSRPEPVEDSYSAVVRAMDAGTIDTVTVEGADGSAEVLYRDGHVAEVVLPAQDPGLLRELAESGADVTVESPGSSGGGVGSVLLSLLPVLVVVALIAWLVVAGRRARGGGGGLLGGDTSLRKSVSIDTPPAERFADVAGADEAVEELQEVAEFFRDPERFARLGARMPAGIMLYGEPGTGKTLLAKALAGEAGVPFYAASGSDFVEKFVGVGAGRVRELFKKAREHERGAVVFIDEIDAVGRARSGADTNGEREQTLNQILVEIDGFTPDSTVVCLAATNRLDVLDPALLRPGRFGRHIAVPLPSAEGRASILAVHAAGKPLAGDVDLAEVAGRMSGLSGAQLAEVVNEAAIMAGREHRGEIGREHFREGYLRVIAGPKRRSAPIADGELEVIAAHEAGHVICAEAGERYEKAQQVTVEPRGQAMGLAVYGRLDRALHDPDYVHEALVALLGGRAAEQVAFGRISSGAANDLQQASALARNAVEELGFSPRVGQVVTGGNQLSEARRAVVEAEIERMVADAYADALAIVGEQHEALDRLAARLVERRELDRVEIVEAIGVVRRGRRQPAERPAPRPLPMLRPVAASEQVPPPLV